MSAEDTPKQHPNLRPPWKKGESGNPAGRPRGARSKLTEAFLSALAEDFEQNGIAAVQSARANNPGEYLRVIAGVVPKQVEGSDDGEPIKHEFAWLPSGS